MPTRRQCLDCGCCHLHKLPMGAIVRLPGLTRLRGTRLLLLE